MYNVEQSISNFVESQFPDFYKEEGPLFVLFAKEYYKWLEQNYVYIRLSNPENFNVGDNVYQSPASGVIESIDSSNILVRVTSDGFRCTSQCLNSIELITSDGGGSSYIREITSTNPIYNARKLFSYRDVDSTTERFLVYFKEKYLKGIQFDTYTAKKTLIKAAQDLYSSKGTERSIDLLFKLVFGVGATTYYPGDDILKPSSGRWVIPNYLEITESPRTISFIGREIIGSVSGARGYCEYIVKRNIKGKIIDVLYLSNVRGTFVTGDSIIEYANQILKDAPIVVGSLTTVDITTGGAGFAVGEQVEIVSSKGVEGKAIVTGIETQTGLVKFTLVDGGWGYSNNSLIVSRKMLKVLNRTNSNTSITDFQRFEKIKQDLWDITLNNLTGNSTTLSVSDVLGGIAINQANATALICDILTTPANNIGTFLVSKVSGDINANSFIRLANVSFITAISNTSSTAEFTIGDVMQQSNGSANVTTGVISQITSTKTLTVNTSSITGNGIHVGWYAKQATTNAAGLVMALPWSTLGSYNTVPKAVLSDTTGTFNTTNIISLYSDAAYTNLQSEFYTTGIANTNTYKLLSVNGARFYPGNTIYGTVSPEISTILVASDAGGILSSYTDVSATANVISVGSEYIGLINVVNAFDDTPNNRIVGLTSNTYGEITLLSTGQGANASIGSLVDTETVRICLDFLAANNDGSVSDSIEFPSMTLNGVNSTYGYISSLTIDNPGSGYDNTNIVVFSGGNSGIGSFSAANATINTDSTGRIIKLNLSANVGSKYVTTPTVSVVNSTGGSTGVGTNASIIPAFPLGFFKLPAGDMNVPLLQLLRFNNRVVGEIASLSNINPGENYNVAPSVIGYEYGIAELDTKDYIIAISNLNGPPFVVNETITQTSQVPSTILSCNALSGNTTLEVNHILTQSNGAAIIASGEVYSYSTNATSNSVTITVVNLDGTFNTSYNIADTQTGGVFQLNTKTTSTLGQIAKGKIKTSNSTVITVSRRSLFNNFVPSASNNLIGQVTLSNCSIVSVTPDTLSTAAGDNAVVTSNVVYQAGSLTSIQVIDSGFGYEQDEGVSMTSAAGETATGKSNVTRYGIGSGYYASKDGFLSDVKKIHDGEYYQEYSYEVQSPIPLDKYTNILREILHVAGTKLFGKVKLSSTVNNNIISTSSITIL